MLFITNRLPKGSWVTTAGRQFTFDLKNNTPSTSMYFCEYNENKKSSIELGSAMFLNKVKSATQKQIVLYIHGFSNLPDMAFKATKEFQDLCNLELENEVLVIPLIWPCDDDPGIIKDYWDDEIAADASNTAFARVLARFLDWRNSNQADNDLCTKRINVVAHSMGNRVLRGAINTWQKQFASNGVPLMFRNTFLIAADIENDSLEYHALGEGICSASKNVVVYYAADDFALGASKVANRKFTHRLGHLGPREMGLVPKNVFSVNCDQVNNRYDNPKGHSYFRYADNESNSPSTPGIVFKHIFSCIYSGRVDALTLNNRDVYIEDVTDN